MRENPPELLIKINHNCGKIPQRSSQAIKKQGIFGGIIIAMIAQTGA